MAPSETLSIGEYDTDLQTNLQTLFQQVTKEASASHNDAKKEQQHFVYPDYILTPPKELQNVHVGYQRMSSDRSKVVAAIARFNSNNGKREGYNTTNGSWSSPLPLEETPTIFTDLYDAKNKKVYDSNTIFTKLHTLIPQSLNENKTGPDKEKTVKDLFALLYAHDPYFLKYIQDKGFTKRVGKKGERQKTRGFDTRTETQVIQDYLWYRNKGESKGFIFSYGEYNASEYFQEAHIGYFATGESPSLQALFQNTIDPQEKVPYRRNEKLGEAAKFLEGHVCVQNPDTKTIAGQMVYHYLLKRNLHNKLTADQQAFLKNVVELHHTVVTDKDSAKAKEMLFYYMTKSYPGSQELQDALMLVYLDNNSTSATATYTKEVLRDSGKKYQFSNKVFMSSPEQLTQIFADLTAPDGLMEQARSVLRLAGQK